MAVGPEHDAPQVPGAQGFVDAVTVAFADPAQELFGMARLGLSVDGPSALAVLFAGGQPVLVRTEPGTEPIAAGAWEDVTAAGLRTAVVEPLGRWTASLDGREEGGFALELVACSEPAELAAGSAVAAAGGSRGFEQMCTVEGTVRAGGRVYEVRCLGQRGRLWGAPDWEGMAFTRRVGAWLDADHAVALSAVRSAGVDGHGDEALSAWLFEGGPPAVALPVQEPRLSTTYDGEGRQRQAGLELWIRDDDDHPRRAAGAVLCGTSLELGRLRLECAFFGWLMDGRAGAGCYDVLRRTA